MAEKECVFCHSEAIKARIIWENDLFYATFDAYPVSPGHCLVIPKRHVVDVTAMNEAEQASIFAIINKILDVISHTDLKLVYLDILQNPPSDTSAWFCQKALDNPNIGKPPDAINYGINDGRAAGRTVDHLHMHIIPRYVGDVDNPLGGVRYVIPVMGNYKQPR